MSTLPFATLLRWVQNGSVPAANEPLVLSPHG
jgi:hypothetical protein